MEIKFVHILGPTLVVIAFLLWGRGMVNKEKGKNFRPLPAMIMMLIAIGFHVFLPANSVPDLVSFGGKFLDQLTLALMNFGIGMLIDASYLSFKKYEHPKVFWVPAILALLLSCGIFLISKAWTTVCEMGSPKNSASTVQALMEVGPDDDISEVEYILKKYKVNYEKAFPSIDKTEDEDLAQYYLIYVDSSYLTPLTNELKADVENIDNVEANKIITLDDPKSDVFTTENSTSFKANDPFLKNQWYAEKLGYDKVYETLSALSPKRKAKVAILDTGVDGVHEDLKTVFAESPANKDEHGHGTHCAGLVGAATNNKLGIGSMNWDGKFIEVRGFQALSADGSGSYEMISQAIIDATDAGSDVISMSLGGPAPFGAPKVMKDAIKYAQRKGAIVVAAAGNSSADAKSYSPANIEGVICVAAIDENFNKAYFSNTNTSLKMPIASPGVNILSAVPNGQYVQMNGTSMATPIVAGLVGILRSLNPNLSGANAYKILKETGLDAADVSKTGRTIQPLAAIEKVK